jgi:hypothetical protein
MTTWNAIPREESGDLVEDSFPQTIPQENTCPELSFSGQGCRYPSNSSPLWVASEDAEFNPLEVVRWI